MPRNVPAPARIGVLHLNQLGDLVFSLPALAALRAGFPRARVTSFVRRELAPLLAPGPLVDEVVAHQGWRDFLATVERLRGLEPDLTVGLSESPRSRLLGYLSGASQRAGLDGGPLASLLSLRVEKLGPPSSANNLRLVRELGCPVPQESYVGLLTVPPEDRRAARALLDAAGRPPRRGRLIVLAPDVSRGREKKAWPAERFDAVAEHLASVPGLCAVLVGAERAADRAARALEGRLDLRGRTDLRQLIGVLSLTELFVGNDSGVLHLAACLGVRCVALFGPTDPVETGPHGGGHVVLRAADGDMASLALEEVIDAVEGLVGRGAGE